MTSEKREDWKIRAAAKRADTLSKIPEEWRLSTDELEAAKRQRDLTGAFIQRFLADEEVAITSRDSVSVVEAIRTGGLTSTKVAKAFCRTAAVAHQIVGPNFPQRTPYHFEVFDLHSGSKAVFTHVPID